MEERGRGSFAGMRQVTAATDPVTRAALNVFVPNPKEEQREEEGEAGHSQDFLQ